LREPKHCPGIDTELQNPVSTLSDWNIKVNPMSEEGKRALKIFLEFWLLIGLLAAFNLFNYFRNGSKVFLVVGIICVTGFIGWALFYLFYVRKSEK
jgi:hypothetical protein